MLLWSIQPPVIWDILTTAGVFRGDRRYVPDFFLPAYRWLSQQMQQRIGTPPQPAACPVWAWYQWGTADQPKPDVPAYCSHLPRGTARVCLECIIADDRVLLSDFDLWHHVLNAWYIPTSEADDLAFEAAWGPHRPPTLAANPDADDVLVQQIRASWHRIFDLDWEEEYCTRKRAEKVIQATFWELRREDVQDMQLYIVP